MLAAEVREALRKQPFEPFRIRLTTGQSYEVRHPEFATVTRTSVYVGVPEGRGEFPERAIQCALLHVVSLEPIDGADQPEGQDGESSSR